MCGIVGSNFHIANHKQVIDVLNPRGPDCCNFKYIDNTFFAHCRLSIIDSFNTDSNQPMLEDDVLIVFNGTIYNYKELQNQYNLPQTNSDTKTLLMLYKKFDTKFLNMLNGSFAFCIYDIKKNIFFCARDRYGKKPLFYYHDSKEFVFSSMINAILKIIQKTPKLNKEALSQYLQFFVPIEENTFYQNIYKLQAGHYLIFDNNTKELKTKKYYKIDTTKTIFDERIAIDTIKQNLFDAVESRLIGDSKIASLLSGGVDSSLVSAIFSRLTDSKIDTFSVGYENHKKYDELKYAQIVSKHINSNHHEIILSKKDFIENIDESIEIMGEPHGDSASIPLNILSKQINQNGFKVVLSGEGSDELFLGYKIYQTILKFYNFQKTLSKEQIDFLYTYIPSIQNNTKESEYFSRIAKKEFLYNSFGETFNNSQKAKLLHKPYFFVQKPTQKDFIDAMSLIDMDIWLGNSLLSKVDAITSYNAVETRTPFLDFRLVNNAFAIESNLKLGNTTKYIIKQIADEFLPQEIVHRSKKGFSTPSNEWIHEHYKDEILNLILEVSNETGLFKNDFIKQIYELSKEGKFRQHLWHLFIFAKWFKKIYL